MYCNWINLTGSPVFSLLIYFSKTILGKKRAEKRASFYRKGGESSCKRYHVLETDIYKIKRRGGTPKKGRSVTTYLARSRNSLEMFGFDSFEPMRHIKDPLLERRLGNCWAKFHFKDFSLGKTNGLCFLLQVYVIVGVSAQQGKRSWRSVWVTCRWKAIKRKVLFLDVSIDLGVGWRNDRTCLRSSTE